MILFLNCLVEQRIAKFHQREDAILYISCFDANAGIFETLLKEQDYIISVIYFLMKIEFYLLTFRMN
jgi:hypothetical protein